MKKLIFALVATLFVLGGCSEDKIIGTWLQPIPGMEDEFQGIRLNKDGSADSVNMRTLQYDHWQRKGDVLILTGQSIGNHQTITIREEYKIQKLDNHTLELYGGGSFLKYTR